MGLFRLFRLNMVKIFSCTRENILIILVYTLHDCYICVALLIFGKGVSADCLCDIGLDNRGGLLRYLLIYCNIRLRICNRMRTDFAHRQSFQVYGGGLLE